MDPTLIASGIGLVGSLFGGGGPESPELPEEFKRLFAQYMTSVKARRRWANGIPGSDPQERAALAQARGLAGQDMASQRAQFMALTGGDAGGMEGTPDMLARMADSQVGRFMSLDSEHLLSSLNARRDARASMPGLIAGGANILSSGYSSGRPNPAQGDDGMSGALSSLAGLSGYLASRNRGSAAPALPAPGGGLVNANSGLGWNGMRNRLGAGLNGGR